MSVGDKVRVARESQRPPWSLEDLGRAVGFTRSKIHEWESGRTKNPKRFDIELVSKAMGIPVDWFYDGKPGPPPTSEPSNAAIVDDPKIREGFSTTVAIRTWASALAGLDGEEECHFEPTDSPYEIPSAFLVGGVRNMDRHDLVTVSGRSMSPLIEPGDRVLFFQDNSPRRNTVVMAESPDGRVYIKVLRDRQGSWSLESISSTGATFTDLAGWKLCGYAVAILGDADTEGRNIRWPFGQPIKA